MIVVDMKKCILLNIFMSKNNLLLFNIIKEVNMRCLLFFVLILVVSCGNSIKQNKEFYENGSLKLFYETFNGLKHGKSVEYYPNGKIKEESNWVNGTINGLFIQYYESGNLESTSIWLNGERHGNSVKYDEIGNLVYVKTYHCNKASGCEMFFYKGIMYQSRQYVLVNDSSYLNQMIRYDNFGYLRDYGSSFFSLYYPYESDTLKLKHKPDIKIILETPYFIDGMPKVQAAVWLNEEYFYNNENQRLDTVNDVIADLHLIFNSPGLKSTAGFVLNHYLDENNTLQEQKFYFRKKFYVIE